MLQRFIIIALCLLSIACSSQKNTGSSSAEQFYTLHSAFAKLDLPAKTSAGVEKNIYILARKGEKNLENVKQYVAKAVQQKGYNIVDGPSTAGYVLHVHVVQQGVVQENSVKSSVDAGYAAPIKSARTMQHEDEEGLASVLMADVLVAARTLPKDVRKRPAVVVASSKNTKVAESKGRVAVVGHGDIAMHNAQALQLLAEQIVKILP